jgi:NhaP-type Na+/H+ or K+/H+ antiporter
MEMATEILCMLFLLMMAISSGHFLKKSGHKYLQEAGLTTLIGMFTGYMLSTLNISRQLDYISHHFVAFFMIILLPPIIFESGYNINKGPFLRNIGTIMMYSFLGTFISITLSSLIFYGTGVLGWTFPFTIKDSFCFGSLISTTDTVAVLSILKEMGADENLFALAFGESIFNDAIGIVAYQTVKNLNGDSDLKITIAKGLGKFLIIFVGSVIVGMMIALTVAFIQKR